ncbi:unnamed protein product, partial [Rhizoctonia solani]
HDARIATARSHRPTTTAYPVHPIASLNLEVDMSADPPSSPTNHERFRQWITDVEVNPENNDPNCKFSARMFIDHDLVCDLPVINSTGALQWSGLLYRDVSPDSPVLLRLCMSIRGRPRYFNFPNFTISEVDEETGEMTLELRDAAWIVTLCEFGRAGATRSHNKSSMSELMNGSRLFLRALRRFRF